MKYHLLDFVLLVKFADVLCNGFSFFLQGKVTGVEEMKIDVVQIPFVRISSFCREDVVVFTPNNQRRRLISSKVFLPFRIQGYIGTVAVKHSQLDLIVFRPCQMLQINVPVVRTDLQRILHGRSD